jgi:hypothetical protein
MVAMDRRDDELLAKQMHGMVPPRNDGLVGLTVAAVFLIGLFLGATVFAPKTPAPPSHDVFAAYSTRAPATVQR